MKIHFFLPYRLQPGEAVVVFGSLPELGQGDPMRGRPLSCEDVSALWTGSIDLPDDGQTGFAYAYALIRADGTLAQREGGPLRLFPGGRGADCRTIALYDWWHPPGDPDAVLDAAPFRDVLFRRRDHEPIPPPLKREPGQIAVHLRVAAPWILPDQRLYVSGATETLGVWDRGQALAMRPVEAPYWEVSFFWSPSEGPLAYKYAVGDADRQGWIWETGEDRLLPDLDRGLPGEADALILTDWPCRRPAGPWRGAGLAVPVFSLRTEQGLGVGEFTDLVQLVDWAKQAGLTLIQLLPVNDTTHRGRWQDAYPYGIVSAFALHPLYVNLNELAPAGSPIAARIAAEAKRLNSLSTVDYEAVMGVKGAFLKDLYEADRGRFLQTEAFQSFFQEQALWLRPYAAFCVLRNRYGACDSGPWPAPYATGTAAVIDDLTDPQGASFPEVAFHYYIQFHLHRQLAAAAAYARSQGVVLKGDIPIGVNRCSADVWQFPSLFHTDRSTGAPPDFFSDMGQNWGFPTYNWPAMAEDDYDWHRRRLRRLAAFFDAVRLDHVIGFFRIWSIPGDAVTALRGRFDPALPFSRAELAASGIDDPEDFCQALIDGPRLAALFGDKAQAVVDAFLEPAGPDRWRFRPEWQSQRRLAASGKVPEGGQEMLHRLFALRDDVLLLQEGQGDKAVFHPRIVLERTDRFARLDRPAQEALRRLGEDYFFHRHEAFWTFSGREKLAALASASTLLLCGEDLGMVPGCVPGVLKDLFILGLRIQRLPETLGKLFNDPETFPYLSVASTGTHDMATLRGWWEEEDRAVIQIYFQDVLGRRGVAPKTCEPWICREIVVQHLKSPSLWAVLPVQDLLGLDETLRRPDPRAERINNPADPHHRWDFRLHLPLEDLLNRTSFNETVREMVRISGREVQQDALVVQETRTSCPDVP